MSSRPSPPFPDGLVAMGLGPSETVLLGSDGFALTCPRTETEGHAAGRPILLCHAEFVLRRAGFAQAPEAGRVFDILELFAFVRPAEALVPSPAGLAEALGLPEPRTPWEDAATLLAAASTLLDELREPDYPYKENMAALAWSLARAGWPWGSLLGGLAGPPVDEGAGPGGLEVWRLMDEWEDDGPPQPSTARPVRAAQCSERLRTLLGPERPAREGQESYAEAARHAFGPRAEARSPLAVLAEAGTGIGKTLGYLAPATLFAESNGPGTWVATYTKALQRQLARELDRIDAMGAAGPLSVVTRKGRENYLCLLNLEEAVRRLATGLAGPASVSLGLLARWAQFSRDKDMVGGDFPAWLAARLPGRAASSLTDRRGECIHAACAHYRKCPVEAAMRSARAADLVIANHAVVLHEAAMDRHRLGENAGERTDTDEDAARLPATRLVFDEAHHLFETADQVFSAHLTGQETAELRRWLRGHEGTGRGRRRGLRDRVSELAEGHAEAEKALSEAFSAARALPGAGWLQRLAGGAPEGAAERFLAAAHAQVLARANSGPTAAYSLEAETADPTGVLLETAKTLEEALGRLQKALDRLARSLGARLLEEADTLPTSSRNRIEGAVRGILRRSRLVLPAWRDMLSGLGAPTPAAFVDWIEIDRTGGRDIDVGLHRHWIDPGLPLSELVLKETHGLVVTSATLAEGALDDPDWTFALRSTGLAHVTRDQTVERVRLPSPFDYQGQTRVLVVTDVAREDAAQVAAAYRSLFLAGKGGALGLFTAIARMRKVYGLMAPDLEAAGLPVYAQHLDAMDVAGLVELFRKETNSCLLGTDALREGIDIPGPSLRLLVFDRVPWPRPSLLHKARREAFGGRAYDDAVTRLRLKQAYGRLVRQDEDRGVFVILDPRTPSRLQNAFPPGVEMERVGLAEAVTIVETFLAPIVPAL